MKDHNEVFADARFAAMGATDLEAKVEHLVTAIDELGFLLSNLHNVAHNAHSRLEMEQERIKKLEDAVRRIPRGGPED